MAEIREDEDEDGDGTFKSYFLMPTDISGDLARPRLGGLRISDT
jgi:hypothetical protein